MNSSQTRRSQADNLKQMVKNNKNKPKAKKDNTNNTKIITVASGKGGVGKSNISLNLSLAIRKLGHKTLLIDADMGMANIDVLVGSTAEYNISHIISGEKNFDNVLLNGPDNLHILPGTTGSGDLINIPSTWVKQLFKVSDRMESEYDVIIIDVGAGGHRDVLNFVKSADESIVVLTPEPTSIMDAYSMIKILSDNDISHKLNLVVNQVGNDKEGKQVSKRVEKAISKFLGFDIETLGYVPYTKKVRDAVKSQTPIINKYPHSNISNVFHDMASDILDKDYSNSSGKLKSLFSKVGNFFG